METVLKSTFQKLGFTLLSSLYYKLNTSLKNMSENMTFDDTDLNSIIAELTFNDYYYKFRTRRN